MLHDIVPTYFSEHTYLTVRYTISQMVYSVTGSNNKCKLNVSVHRCVFDRKIFCQKCYIILFKWLYIQHTISCCHRTPKFDIFLYIN